MCVVGDSLDVDANTPFFCGLASPLGLETMGTNTSRKIRGFLLATAYSRMYLYTLRDIIPGYRCKHPGCNGPGLKRWCPARGGKMFLSALPRYLSLATCDCLNMHNTGAHSSGKGQRGFIRGRPTHVQAQEDTI